MKLIINGEERAIPECSSLSDLLVELHLPEKQILIEHNAKPVPRNAFAMTKLSSGDHIEIVQMVAGG